MYVGWMIGQFPDRYSSGHLTVEDESGTKEWFEGR